MDEDAPAPRVAVVTGASRGIGRHLAEHLLARGWTVAGCSRKETDLEHQRYRHVRADVCDEGSVRDLFREVRRELGGVDALVNNAGIASMNLVALTPLEVARAVTEVNLLGTFLCCREAAKQMQRRGSGRIVNLSTVAVPLRVEGEAIYAASKAGVESLTRVLAHELGSSGVTVNAVGPTPIRTDLIRGVAEERIAALVQRQAVKRLGEARDVANVVDFFLRPESDFVTGQVVYLGGV